MSIPLAPSPPDPHASGRTGSSSRSIHIASLSRFCISAFMQCSLQLPLSAADPHASGRSPSPVRSARTATLPGDYHPRSFIGVSLLPLLIRSIPRFHARRFLPMDKGYQAFFPPLQPSMLRTSLQGRPPQSPWRFIAPFHSFRRSTKLTPSRRPYNKKSATPAVISRRHQRS